MSATMAPSPLHIFITLQSYLKRALLCPCGFTQINCSDVGHALSPILVSTFTEEEESLS